MRLQQYINEKFNMTGVMIGYEVDKNAFKSLSDQIGEILRDNNIPYELIVKPHISIAQITGKYPKDELKREMDKIKPVKFNPKGITMFWGFNVKKWFVVAEYKARPEFTKKFKELSEKYEVRSFPGGMKPHTSLMMINEDIPEDIQNQIKSLGKKLPKIKVRGVALFNNKFQVEFKKKIKEK